MVGISAERSSACEVHVRCACGAREVCMWWWRLKCRKFEPYFEVLSPL